jgi:hypothetical protein
MQWHHHNFMVFDSLYDTLPCSLMVLKPHALPTVLLRLLQSHVNNEYQKSLDFRIRLW